MNYKINENDIGMHLIANAVPFFAVRYSRPCQEVQLYCPLGGKVVQETAKPGDPNSASEIPGSFVRKNKALDNCGVYFKRDSFPGSWVCLTRVLVCAYTNKLKGSSSVSPNGVT